MALKQYNPTSPGQRGLVTVDRSGLYKGKPVKKLTEGLTKTGGRNNSGHVTAWQKGGGHKRKYRMVDFKRRKMDVMATVERIEYDPNRTAFIALITYDDGEQAYILAPQRLAAGDKVVSSSKADIQPVLMYNLLDVINHIQSFVSLLVKFVWFGLSAWQQSELYRIQINRTLNLVKLAAVVGSDVVQMSVVLR